MDFSYFNNNNEKVKLNISIGSNWDELNIQNQALNSIFAKVDDGDRKISENELSLLEKLLKKADSIIEKSANNKILENDELEEIANKIDKGEITLPKQRIAKVPQNLLGSGYIEIQHTKQEDIINKNKNPEKFQENEIEKLKNKLEERYPSEDFELELFPDGRGYSYNVYCLNCKKPNNASEKVFSQGISIIRDDGIEIGFKDHYQNDIADNENADYSKIHQSASFGTFTIADKEGKVHSIDFNLSELGDRDILDCRRVTKQIAEFISQLPEETINEIIEKGVTDIEFRSEYDDPFLADKDYFRNKMDKNGNVIEIEPDFATIISPSFKPPERKYNKDFSFERSDGYKFEAKENELTIKTPEGKNFKIELSGDNTDKYYQWQFPKLKRLLSEMPKDVLRDFCNEISAIAFMDENVDSNGQYVIGSDTIAYKADYDWETPAISFVHELGHAIDNQNGTMFSQNPEFADKFAEFKELTQKLGITQWNHALDMPEEFFASEYANHYYPADKSSNNHIAEIERKLEGFENSSNEDKRLCYQLFRELQNDVQTYVEQAHGFSNKERSNRNIRELVRNECGDIITEAKEHMWMIKNHLSGQNIELELIGTLAANEKDFDAQIKFYEKFSTNSRTNMLDQHLETPEEIQQFYGKIITKLMELRAKIK